MNKEEKILLLQLILEDIRGNWGYKNAIGVNRKSMAYQLSNELYQETLDDNWAALRDTIQMYEHGEDGRYFRDDFPLGYLGMEDLYNIPRTYNDKSAEFKYIADEYITFPDLAFNDREG